jgi:hypothetical protein
VKILRSSKCSLKFANKNKLEKLSVVMEEYSRIVNLFIDSFWTDTPAKALLLKPIVDSVLPSWLTARLRKVAAREAIDMITSVRRRWEDNPSKITKPLHRGNRMCVSSTIAEMRMSWGLEFDGWLYLTCLGDKLKISLPIKLHKQFHKWDQKGKRLESYVITREYVQFAFEIETGSKQPKEACVGVDTGIKALASLSTGEQLGTDTEEHINRIKRCKHGSKGQKRASRALRQRMDEIARDVCKRASLVVVENLKNITLNRKRNVKRRLTKNMRRSIGRWNVRYWLDRLRMTCEEMNVSFRSVSPYKTSQTCPFCGHVDRRNRSGESFMCRKCERTGNADIFAGMNILERFLTGPYGVGCKPLVGHLSSF